MHTAEGARILISRVAGVEFLKLISFQQVSRFILHTLCMQVNFTANDFFNLNNTMCYNVSESNQVPLHRFSLKHFPAHHRHRHLSRRPNTVSAILRVEARDVIGQRGGCYQVTGAVSDELRLIKLFCEVWP